jgi:Ca-activated chloride channel family protein
MITDACPNADSDEHGLPGIAERAFISSKGTTTCVTYIGVGLTFNAQVANELSRVHGTTICSVITAEQLHRTLVEEFNYIISPIAYDLRVSIESQGVELDGYCLYGSDLDVLQSSSSYVARPLTASPVHANGVKGSVIVGFNYCCRAAEGVPAAEFSCRRQNRACYIAPEFTV